MDEPCPSCGGAGGGPFGPAGSAWDDESWVCPRCEGTGALVVAGEGRGSVRPGLAKASPGAEGAEIAPRRAAGDE
ncbi:MAG: hypothetical protein JNL38_17380 [Myxococcales bacterium]|jgi:hypothetical protein|nr:hypothetical protein [Myxococcales bacterium]